VVHGEQSDVLLLREAQQSCAHERPRREVEGASGLFVYEASGRSLSLCRGQLLQVGDGQVRCLCRVDELPRLAVLHPRYRTPALAILVQAGWATVLTLSGTFAQLVDYVAFGDWIFFGLTVAGLFIYRARDGITAAGPVAGGAFRVPGYPWTPGLFVLAALYVVASAILANPRNALIGAGLLALGVPVYLLSARSSGRGVV